MHMDWPTASVQIVPYEHLHITWVFPWEKYGVDFLLRACFGWHEIECLTRNFLKKILISLIWSLLEVFVKGTFHQWEGKKEGIQTCDLWKFSKFPFSPKQTHRKKECHFFPFLAVQTCIRKIQNFIVISIFFYSLPFHANKADPKIIW